MQTINRVIASINEQFKSYILLFDGTELEDTEYNRAMHYRKGWIVTQDGKESIPYTCYTTTREKARKRAGNYEKTCKVRTVDVEQKKRRPRIESASQMFEIAKGKRFHKKPGSGGSFRVNPKLMGMSTNSQLERTRDREYFFERYTNIVIAK